MARPVEVQEFLSRLEQLKREAEDDPEGRSAAKSPKSRGSHILIYVYIYTNIHIRSPGSWHHCDVAGHCDAAGHGGDSIRFRITIIIIIIIFP